MGGGSSASSSGEEDGDASWKKAIESVATVGVDITTSNGRTRTNMNAGDSTQDDLKNHQDQRRAKSPALKLYQIKAQKILDDLIGKSLEIVRNPVPLSAHDPQSDEGRIRLFSKAPPGVQLDPIDPHTQPRKRARILPWKEIDEKSKKFRRQLRSVAVEGDCIAAAARDACQRSLARLEARDAAAKVAAKREEERVAELKKVRGEEWLPSIAREMQGGTTERMLKDRA